jgi:hypothetical protein
LQLQLTWPTVSGTVGDVWEPESLDHTQDILRHQILSPLEILMEKEEVKIIFFRTYQNINGTQFL